MPSKKLILASMALMAAAATPAFAQNGMMTSDGMHSGGMHMTKTQIATMSRCKKMSHHVMMKNRKCMSMMQMHRGMMGDGSMIHDGDMGKKHQ